VVLYVSYDKWLIFRIFENSDEMEANWITLVIFGFYLFFYPFLLKRP